LWKGEASKRTTRTVQVDQVTEVLELTAVALESMEQRYVERSRWRGKQEASRHRDVEQIK